MGVLPDRSKKIVPSVYHGLMTDPNSPIIDFYPRDFELDMNGKKMEWEAVVKIPFIAEDRLLSAMAPCNELLSPEEKARNDFGVSLKFTYDSNSNFTYPSSLVGIFPDIPNCRCVENIFDLPTAEGLDLYVGLLKETKIGVDALAGFPSLATLPYNATIGFHGVNVFQQESRNESLVVTLSDVQLRCSVESAKLKLGQICYVGYPFLQEAKVVRVSDELFDYTHDPNNSGQVLQVHHSGRDIEEWNQKASRIENFYSKRLGIIIGSVECLIHVDMLKGLLKTDEGATIKTYGPIPGMEADYASQVIVDEVVSPDERFIERAAVPIEEEFPIGTNAFFLGGADYGSPLEVIGHAGNKAEIVLLVSAKEPDFAGDIVRRAEQRSGYKPSFAVAKDLGLHPLILSKITSSFFVYTVGGSMKVNLGLNLKFEGRKQKVLGYSRKSKSGWEFSPATVVLLVDYMTRFPDFFAAILRNPSGGELNETDLWSDPVVASARVKEIGAWLKTIETSKFERVPLDAQQLDSEVVLQLQKAADVLRDSNIKVSRKKMTGVPRSALLHPKDSEQRLSHQTFKLGDRVIYVQASGKVPIHSRGTVVGISTVGNHHVLDILWDNAFMNGTSLNGRCDSFRGQTVPANSVLNVSQRQVVAGSKPNMESQSSQTPLTLHRHGPSTGHQLRDAVAPGPLRGSWRGALNTHNHHIANGRGSPSRQGPRNPMLHLQHSSLVYRTHPEGQRSATNGEESSPPSRSDNQRWDRGNRPVRGGRGGRDGQNEPSGFNVGAVAPVLSDNGVGSHQNYQAYNATPLPNGTSSQHSVRGDQRSGRGGRNGRGERGRGGNGGSVLGPIAGAVSTQLPSSSVGNSQVQQSYNAVPPPAELDSRGGERGRARGRGRGRGRGRRPRGGNAMVE